VFFSKMGRSSESDVTVFGKRCDERHFLPGSACFLRDVTGRNQVYIRRKAKRFPNKDACKASTTATVLILCLITPIWCRNYAGIAVDFVRMLFGPALRNPGHFRREPKQTPNKDGRRPSAIPAHTRTIEASFTQCLPFCGLCLD
jgi:hypothetical protein